MALAYLYMHMDIKNTVLNRRALTLLVVISAMYIIPSYLGGYNRGIGLAGYGLWSLLILTACLMAEKIGVIKWNSKMIFIGTISYSLYLFHIPVHELIKSLNPTSFGEIKNNEIRAFCVMSFELTASILVAYISYILIELPSVSAARTLTARIKRLTLEA